MKKILLILCLFPILVFSQKSYKIPADSTILNNIGSGKNELVIRNATSNITGGVLTNLGNGVTAFVVGAGSGVSQTTLNDSILAVRNIRKVDTLYKNFASDSIIFFINGIRYSVLDKDNNTSTFTFTKNATQDSIIATHDGVRSAVKDSIGVDTDAQTLTAGVNTLTISGGNTVDLNRKVDSSYLFRNSSLDSICQVTIINGLSYRSCAKDSLPTVSSTSTTTFTNKRITARVDSTTSSATPTINTDNIDTYKLTAQAVDITSFTTNLTGTPTDDQILHIVIIGTATRAIIWGSSFEASTVALPTTTVSTDRLDVYFIWNTATSKWRCGGVW